MNCFASSHETRRFVNLMRSVDLRDVNATPLTEHEPTRSYNPLFIYGSRETLDERASNTTDHDRDIRPSS